MGFRAAARHPIIIGNDVWYDRTASGNRAPRLAVFDARPHQRHAAVASAEKRSGTGSTHLFSQHMVRRRRSRWDGRDRVASRCGDRRICVDVRCGLPDQRSCGHRKGPRPPGQASTRHRVRRSSGWYRAGSGGDSDSGRRTDLNCDQFAAVDRGHSLPAVKHRIHIQVETRRHLGCHEHRRRIRPASLRRLRRNRWSRPLARKRHSGRRYRRLALVLHHDRPRVAS